jgi:hypothetical protein
MLGTKYIKLQLQFQITLANFLIQKIFTIDYLHNDQLIKYVAQLESII